MPFVLLDCMVLDALRGADFPSSLYGKGHDTGVVCKWLEAALNNMDSWRARVLQT